MKNPKRCFREQKHLFLLLVGGRSAIMRKETGNMHGRKGTGRHFQAAKSLLQSDGPGRRNNVKIIDSLH